MKASFLALLLCITFNLLTVSAQQSRKSPVTTTYAMDIGYTKTSSIVFPYAIHSVDKGSQDILVQKAMGLENVLQVKAGKLNFEETNLTVITTDGKLYAFTVCFTENPEQLTHIFSDGVKSSQISYTEPIDNQQQLLYGAELAYHERKKVSYREAANGITLSVTGIFIHNDLIHYRLSIANDTYVSYDIDQLRFFIRDQKKARRTASQEVEIVPVWVYKETGKIPAKGAATFVCVLPKFTIPDSKNLVIELMESSGGRHLQLELKNSKTDKVFPIPAFSN